MDEARLARWLVDYTGAWQSCDAAAIGKLFCEDAPDRSPDGTALHLRAARVRHPIEAQRDASLGIEGRVRAAEIVCEIWRGLEEFNHNASLALEALFVRRACKPGLPVRA